MIRKSRQQVTKLYEKKCYFCPEDNYKLLDVHRIFEGKDGGTYHPMNTIVICCKCHRKVHTGLIKIFRKHLSSSGKWVLHYIDENGQEQWN